MNWLPSTRPSASAINALAFFSASFVGGAIYSIFKVKILGHFDPKFKNAPEVAFGLDLLGALGLSFIGAVISFLIIFISFALLADHNTVNKRAILVILIGASFYIPVLDRVGAKLSAFGLASGAQITIMWALLVLYPVSNLLLSRLLVAK